MQKELCGGKRWKLQAEAKMGLLHLQGEKTNPEQSGCDPVSKYKTQAISWNIFQ